MAESCEVDCFKEEFKRYKKRDADFRNVIDFSCLDQHSSEAETVPLNLPDLTAGSSDRASRLGLKPPGKWLLYRVTAVPGLLFLSNPFAIGCQHRWVRRCLVDYPCRPNVCSLDAHCERKGDGRVWPGEGGLVVALSGEGGLEASAQRKRLRVSKDDMLQKLRWVTLGYHYDWTKKEYSHQNRSPFPADLSELSSFLLEVTGFPRFSAEAAIVNYYHLDSTLSGHTDHSEKDLSLPLLSISFGQSAIFLVGGKTKQIRPKALLLQSGDVIVMSSESRLAYHGVPRVLPPLPDNAVPYCLSLQALQHSMKEWGSFSKPKEAVCGICGNARTKQSVEGGSCLEEDGFGEDIRGCPYCQELVGSWQEFIDYLSVSRINVNVRQVVSEKYEFEDT